MNSIKLIIVLATTGLLISCGGTGSKNTKCDYDKKALSVKENSNQRHHQYHDEAKRMMLSKEADLRTEENIKARIEYDTDVYYDRSSDTNSNNVDIYYDKNSNTNYNNTESLDKQTTQSYKYKVPVFDTGIRPTNSK